MPRGERGRGGMVWEVGTSRGEYYTQHRKTTRSRAPLVAVVKDPPASARDMGSRKSPGEGNGNSLQYACVEIPMDKGGVLYSPRGCRIRYDLATEQQQPTTVYREPYSISMINHNGKKVYVYTYIYMKSVHHAAEINNTVNQLYFNQIFFNHTYK